jgi:hypothetical protein
MLATDPNVWFGSGSCSIWNRTVATCLTTRKPCATGNGLVLLPKHRHFNITTLPPIKYLSSDHIMTWSVCRLCSSTRSVTLQIRIYDPTNIRWVAIEYLPISLTMRSVFAGTQRISVGLQLVLREVKEWPEVQNLHTDRLTMNWEFKYLIGGQGVGTVKLELQSGSNPAEKQLIYVRSGYPSWEDIPGWVFAWVTNQTKPDHQPKTGSLAGYPDLLLILVMAVMGDYRRLYSLQ